MKWFGFGAGRGEPRPALSRAGGVGVVGAWPQGYEAQVRAGYCGNAVAQRAVRLVAEAVASAPLNATEPAVAALIGARSGGQALLEALATQLMLHGTRRWRSICRRRRSAARCG